MKIQRPKAYRPETHRNTDILFFPEKEQGNFYIRGGIAWPGEQPGYALICCQHLEDKKLYVFEEIEFTNITNILDEAGGVLHQGLETWLKMVSKHYGCIKFFHHENRLTNKRWLLKISECKQIKIKPIITPAIIAKQDQNQKDILEQSRHIVREKLQRRELEYTKKGGLYQQLQQENSSNPVRFPAISALIAAINGIEIYPFYIYQKRAEYQPLCEAVGY